MQGCQKGLILYGLMFLQVNSADFFGGVLLQSPFLCDFDQREMFCFYVFPGNIQSRKVC
jgi:hypothetical protein